MDANTTTHHLEHQGDPAPLLAGEWLLTNGTGAYSMGTALGCNTRRYHGLLIAATQPPVGRIVALNQVLDQLILTNPSDSDKKSGPDQTLELACCRFPSSEHPVTAPRGDQLLDHFEKGLTARWTYRWGDIQITRELVLHWQAQAITLRYTIQGLDQCDGPAKLRLSPMMTLRDFHALQHDADTSMFNIQNKDAAGVTLSRGDVSVSLSCQGATFQQTPDWWHDLLYERDTQRGQGDIEHYFVPGYFEVELQPRANQCVEFTAALGDTTAKPADASPRAKHLSPIASQLPGDEALQETLAIACDDFVVQRTLAGEKLSTILAGYPWFADWGRDTFIALPGLLLCTGRLDEASRVLRAFAGSLRNGLVPNRFDDYKEGEAHYNTVDASLWFVHAGLEYAEHRGELEDWLAKALIQVVEAHADGTEAHSHDGVPIRIAMDDDGLISAGNDHSQLTWMDAACGGEVFTPRPGKCVEINALWHHALLGLADALQKSDPAKSKRYRDLAKRCAKSFNQLFWSDEHKRLIDHVRPDGTPDASLRPNQAFACSLSRSPLLKKHRKPVLDAIQASLLIPMGLRTLPPNDMHYHPHYGGPQMQRDAAYHQGTAWPWLIGAYAEGLLRAGNFTDKSKKQANAVITPLLNRLQGEGVGQLAEIHDAEPTDGQHAPRGCPAQAWSVAEVTRILCLINHS